MGEWRQADLGGGLTRQAGSPSEMISFRLSERPYLKAIRLRAVQKDTRHPALASACEYMGLHSCTLTSMQRKQTGELYWPLTFTPIPLPHSLHPPPSPPSSPAINQQPCKGVPLVTLGRETLHSWSHLLPLSEVRLIPFCLDLPAFVLPVSCLQG